MNITELLSALLPNHKESLSISLDSKSLYISKDQIVSLLKDLKTVHGFNMLADLTAIDREDSFEMVYHLMSLETADIVTVKVMLTKTAASIDSIVSIWAAANVQEREVFDMFGIQFNGHPNLTRILNPEDYTEFPLLKSFVLTSIDRQTLS